MGGRSQLGSNSLPELFEPDSSPRGARASLYSGGVGLRSDFRLPAADGFAIVWKSHPPFPGTTLSPVRKPRLDAGTKKMARQVATASGLFVGFLGMGWIFMSLVEGWSGVLLWILVTILACFAVEFFLRPRAHRGVHSARSLPRMRVRTPVRGAPERSVAVTRTTKKAEFKWRREEPPVEGRRRSVVSR